MHDFISSIKTITLEMSNYKYGIFPHGLKISVIEAIYKKEDENKYENYRPVILLPSISKIFQILFAIEYCRFY